jgi:hypothetical protein
MTLREHQQMSHQGLSTWPPVWVWIDGEKDENPKGEIGILKRVRMHDLASHRFFLVHRLQQRPLYGLPFFSMTSRLVRKYSTFYRITSAKISK